MALSLRANFPSSALAKKYKIKKAYCQDFEWETASSQCLFVAFILIKSTNQSRVCCRWFSIFYIFIYLFIHLGCSCFFPAGCCSRHYVYISLSQSLAPSHHSLGLFLSPSGLFSHLLAIYFSSFGSIFCPFVFSIPLLLSLRALFMGDSETSYPIVVSWLCRHHHVLNRYSLSFSPKDSLTISTTSQEISIPSVPCSRHST